MADIQVITLDLDNTLWDVDSVIIKAEATMRNWLSEHAPAVMALYEPTVLEEVRAQVMQEHAHKRHDLTFMRKQVLTLLGQRAGYAPDDAASTAAAAFEIFFEGRNSVEFFPGALTMLAEVSARYPIYALTNGNADIDKAGIGQYLQGAYSSADVGASKPDVRMFNAPLRDLGLKPKQAVHIGDNLTDDIHGANDAGLFTIWVNLKSYSLTPDDPSPHHEVDDLTHIHQAIQAIHHP